ncbi:unnamed protein product [Urochloa humidicola]
MEGFFRVTPKISKEGKESRSFSFIDLTARSEPLDIDDISFSFLTELPGIYVLVLLDSCNGLILFGHPEKPYTGTFSRGYTVCNPTTKQWEAVPACSSAGPITYTYLAFDPAVSSHFHLIQLEVDDTAGWLMSVHAYSSETGTWSHDQTGEQEEQGQLERWHHQARFHIGDEKPPWCAFVNGFLHLNFGI